MGVPSMYVQVNSLKGSERKEECDDMRVEESVEINRPVEEVYEYVANPENLPEWSGMAIETRKDTPGPLLEGFPCRSLPMSASNSKGLAEVAS